MSDAAVNNKRIAKNTLFLYFRTFLVMLVSLYTSRVVLNILGEDDYGIYNLVGGIVVLFSFMNTAMAAATQRYLNFYLGRDEIDEVRRVFSMSIIVHLILVVVVLILGETLGLWFVQTQLNIPSGRTSAAFWVYQFSLIACCVGIIRIPYNAAIIAYEKMDFYAYLSIIEVLLKLGIVYLLLITSVDGLIAYSFLILLVGLLVFLMYKFYCNRHFDTTKVKWFWDKGLFSKLLSFSGWSLFGSIANVSATQGLSIFINLFNGLAANAALGLSHQIQSALCSFISSFQTAFSPQIVKSYAANDNTSFINLIFRSSRISYCLVFLFAIPLMVCITPILHIWLVEVPEYTASFSVVCIIYCMFDALSGPLWVAVQATGNIRRYQITISLLILLNLPLAYLVLEKGFSPVWALSIRAAINILAYFYRILFLVKHLDFPGLKYLKEVMLPITVMTIISFPICLYIFKLYSSISTLVFAIGTMLIVNLLLAFFMGLKESEREFILNYIRNRVFSK